MKPGSTYRLQLHAGFGFDAAAGIADYLEELGIAHVYSSPYLQAARGSTHGYDVVEHGRVNDELGGKDAHERFCKRLGDYHLGQVLDIVPNHMAITGRDNKWWWDVLENGPASRYASYFDVEWQTPEEKLRNKVLAPVLGNHYGRVLEAGEVRLEREGGSFVFRYFEHTFPAAPDSIGPLLKAAADRCGSEYLAFLADSLAIPRDRHRDKEVVRRLLARLCEESSEIARSIDASVERVNHDVDEMDGLLEHQNYRLSYWRTADRELGYRRFFDINSLVGLRVSEPRVFEDTHALVLDWLKRGVIDGVRVDHPDGLRDPQLYFERLHAAAPDAWIVAEKILAPGEPLRCSWKVAGTTGYDFLNALGGLFVDGRNEEAMDRLYRDFTSETRNYHAVVHDKKQLVLRDILGSDVNRLTAYFSDICESHREYRDYTRHEIHHALREVIACFPVYRSYIRPEEGQMTAEDARVVETAIAAARANRTDLDPELFHLIQSVLTLGVRGQLESEFVMRFQQFTGTAMAKGVEDTAFYCYNRLVSLNEVGGDPGRFGVTPEEFHSFCRSTDEKWPDTMLATSTHDTKRSEDVRARISLLSEIPRDWGDEVRFWASRNDRHRTNGDPDRNTEYLLYQTMIGAWPISKERLIAYMEKAVREAKQQTSWANPNEAYENKLRGFIGAVMDDAEFLNDFETFLRPLIDPGWITALSQVLIKLTAPGVPDIYQGTELWDLSLVDPDNRRPVDFEKRRALLRELDALSAEQIWERRSEGLPKLWTIRQALKLRDQLGTYRPVLAKGAKAEHAVAFMRGDGVAVIAPRLVIGLGGDWQDTSVEIPEGAWRNELTGDLVPGGKIELGPLLKRFPAALLGRH